MALPTTGNLQQYETRSGTLENILLGTSIKM